MRVRLGVLIQHSSRYYKQEIKCFNHEKSNPSLENIDLGKQLVIRIKLFLFPTGYEKFYPQSKSESEVFSCSWSQIKGYGHFLKEILLRCCLKHPQAEECL